MIFLHSELVFNVKPLHSYKYDTDNVLYVRILLMILLLDVMVIIKC